MYVVKGVSDEGIQHEWSGCGWADDHHGKRYDKHDANMVAFDANCSADFTAWAEPI